MPLPRIIAIDFDDTLAEDRFPRIGRPIEPVVNRALREQSEGARIILHTCRTGSQLEDAIKFCHKTLGLRLDAVNGNVKEVLESPMYCVGNIKPYACEYWDDKAFNVHEIVAAEIRRDRKLRRG